MAARTVPQDRRRTKGILARTVLQNPAVLERIGQGREIGTTRGWPLKLFDPDRRISGHRLLLIGDAAGLINPLSGGGIQDALLSARWAAQCLIPNVYRDDVSERAMQTYAKMVVQELEQDFLLSRLLTLVARSRALLPLCMGVMDLMIERAGLDPEYADNTVAGVFEGSSIRPTRR